MVEYRAGQAGLTGLGFVAHVPHYLAQAPFAQATAAIVRRVNEAAGLSIPLGDLDEQASAHLAAINSEVTDDSDFPTLLAQLEEQYDQLAETGTPSVPTADEIGAAVEQFLAEQDDTDNGRR